MRHPQRFDVLLLGWAALLGLALPALFCAVSRPRPNGPLPPVPIPASNPQTPAKISLGRQLYFDPRLSADDTISCATCHNPKTAWAGHDATDTGVHGRVGTRNSGTVVNAAYMRYQFWDGRAKSLEEQAIGPIHNPVEMGETMEHVVQELNALPGYRQQFRKVFGTEVTTDGIAKAIASFERTIVNTGPSPFDKFSRGDRRALGASAARGRLVFNGRGGCLACHDGPTFSDQSFHNLGVGMGRPKPDLGRFDVTKAPQDRGRHKTPGLRNVALTAPYFHDGSVKTLAEAVGFLDRGGRPNANLDSRIHPLKLTAQEKRDLVAFMEALTGPFPVMGAPALPKEAPPRARGARRSPSARQVSGPR